jgi:hypothetical protein
MSLNEFRIFYNHTIHPELMRQERRRKSLLRLILFSLIFLAAVALVSAYISVPALTILLLLGVASYLTYLINQVKLFQEGFKPKVVSLILDFIDNSVSFGTLYYDEKKFISRERFEASKIFGSNADLELYRGEDQITGRVGEMEFEMSELVVRELSQVRSRYHYIFRGVFLHAKYHKELSGELLILPRAYKQFLSRSILAFTARKYNCNVDSLIENEDFKKYFTVYAWDADESPCDKTRYHLFNADAVETVRSAAVFHLLSKEMQSVLVDYREKIGREIYVSFIGRDIHVAVTQPKDMLEPHPLKSNVSFDLVREFYEDLTMLFGIVRDFDANT